MPGGEKFRCFSKVTLKGTNYGGKRLDFLNPPFPTRIEAGGRSGYCPHRGQLVAHKHVPACVVPSMRPAVPLTSTPSVSILTNKKKAQLSGESCTARPFRIQAGCSTKDSTLYLNLAPVYV